MFINKMGDRPKNIRDDSGSILQQDAYILGIVPDRWAIGIGDAGGEAPVAHPDGNKAQIATLRVRMLDFQMQTGILEIISQGPTRVVPHRGSYEDLNR